jgi:hypothetical protein
MARSSDDAVYQLVRMDSDTLGLLKHQRDTMGELVATLAANSARITAAQFWGEIALMPRTSPV